MDQHQDKTELDRIFETSEETLKFINKCKDLRKTHLRLSETLTQHLINLDGLNFSEQDKKLRKEFIQYIQGLLDKLDQITIPELIF